MFGERTELEEVAGGLLGVPLDVGVGDCARSFCKVVVALDRDLVDWLLRELEGKNGRLTCGDGAGRIGARWIAPNRAVTGPESCWGRLKDEFMGSMVNDVRCFKEVKLA